MSIGEKEPQHVSDLGGEAREGFGSGAHYQRLLRYGRARENALQFRDYLAGEGEGRLANDLSQCGNHLLFRNYYTVGQYRLAGMCTCKKHLLCPLCAIRRGAKALRVYLERVTHLLASDELLRPYMVTLTVKNGDNLTERFRHLASHVRAYHKRRKGKGQTGEVRKASSAVWSYEFTNRGNGWHPHVHAVWLCREAPDPYKLSEEWHALTGDSYIVDVRQVNMLDPVKSFCEVFKYAVKFSDLPNNLRLEAFRNLQGKRLLDSFGDLRGLVVEVDDSDDILEDLPYIEIMYSYQRGVGYFEKSRLAAVS